MDKLKRKEIIGMCRCSDDDTVKSILPKAYKQAALFIYESKPRFHKFYDHSQSTTYRVGNSL